MTTKDLLLTVEKSKLYQDLIESIQKKDRPQFMKEVSEMAIVIDSLCVDFDELMQSNDGPDKFLKAMGSAINRRAFHDNNGVTEFPWPEKS